ncbi:MAG: polyprenyl synthetase family protein [Bacteroidota bacterium]|nr:polyprenyl synthetase family protein [Bacteroidota bacterium]
MSISPSIDGKQKKNGLQSFGQLSAIFEEKFKKRHFPDEPQQLYDASQYLLTAGGKRIRPVMCLMANEMFDELKEDAYEVATAIELFHNFTLVHDDIMDRAPLRRGMPTVHTKFGEPTALLAGDVMLIAAYENLNKISNEYLHRILSLFNSTAKKVCEGQQLDMEFEKMEHVNFDTYVKMISLKTSVLLAASLQMGAILGGAGAGNQGHLYEFGKNLGIAFQVQDDYLDAFGNPEKFGKKQGGDIMANKKTFLWLQAMEVSSDQQKGELRGLSSRVDDNKIEEVLSIYKSCNIDGWAKELKQKYFSIAMVHLEEIAVTSVRKKPLEELAKYLMERDM